MAEYQSASFPFNAAMLDLADVRDQIPRGHFALATNVRSYKGSIQSRPGFTALATATGSAGVQSIRRLNDYEAATYTYLVMAGTTLFTGQSGALASVSAGFSGAPMTSAIAAPINSPRPYAYIGDATQQGKLKVDDTTLTNWGVPSPSSEPFAELGPPLYTVISDCESAGDWAESGTAQAPGLVLRVDTTVTDIGYDNTAPANASIGLDSMLNVGRGIFLTLDGSEVVLVDDVIPAIKSTTIAQIIYDSGSTGLCSIQLSTRGSRKHLRKGALVQVGGEGCAVLDATIGPDGLPSIRVNTVGTHAAGAAVVGLACVRAYVNGTFATGALVQTNMVESVITAGLGYLTDATPVDASVAGTRPITEEDEMHISLLVDNLSNLTEMRVFLDVDSTVNDFTRNYYWKTLSPNDFVPVVANELTTLEGRINRLQHKLLEAIQAGDFARAEAIRQRIANKQAHLEELSKTPLDDQSVLGDSQFTELRFKVRELFRVGAEVGRDLKDVQAVRVQVNCTGELTLDIDAWWIGGAYGPDIGDNGLPYHYMIRGRSKTTGARSNWSPMTRSGIEAHRQSVILTPPSFTDPQVDTIDYARFGGTLPNWKIIGNGPAGQSFTDMWDDESVLQMPDAENDEHQPWAVTDRPASGTCKVAGSSITRLSGDPFDTGWEKFSVVFVNDVPCTLSGPPLSADVLQVNENAGASGSATYYIPSPLLAGVPLPCVWGPYGYGASGVVIFGVGDARNPGTLYWTIGNNPDVQHATGSLEVCSPGEQLMNGVIWEGRAFVFSSENVYEILPSFDTVAQFVAQKIAGAKGLYAAYALCVAPEGIYHLYKDGIYLNGITKVSDDLYPIFPHDGQAGVAVNGYNPPDYSQVNSLRFEYNDGYVYFTFLDTGGVYKSFVYDTAAKAWSVDAPNVSRLDVLCYYAIEGGNAKGLLAGGASAGGTNTVYTVTGTSDAGGAIACEIDTWSDNLGDLRLQKVFGDLWLDFDAQGANITASVGFDVFSVNPTPDPQTLTNAARGNTPIDVNAGEGQLARDVGLSLAWSSSTVVVTVYAWGFTYVPKADDTTRRYTDPDDGGYQGAKFLQGMILHANTFGENKSVTIQTDNGADGAWQDVATFTINHAQESTTGYSIPVSSFSDSLNVGHLFRLKTNDAVDWELLSPVRWVYEPDAELVEVWKTQQTANAQQGYMHQRDYYLSLLSFDDVTLTVIIDGVTYTYIIPSTEGERRKVYLIGRAAKGKSYQYEITSPMPFRLYKSDCECRTRSWGSDGPYQVVNPFGGPHFTDGAAI